MVVGRAQRSRSVVEGLHEMARDNAVLDALLDDARAQSAVVALLPAAEARRHAAVLLTAAERRLAQDLGHAQEHALRRLLRGEPVPAAELGLTPDGTCHCVVATEGPPLGCAAEAAMDGHRAALTSWRPRLEAGRVVIVAPPGTPAEAAARYPACVAALDVAPGPGVHDLLDLAPGVAHAGQPVLGALLAAHLLAGLNPEDDFHRELAATALSYLDHAQRLDRTAAALFVHPNTVRYRLRRLHDVIGAVDRLTMPEAIRLWWALRHWLA